jgi:hypothetical protein
LEAERHRAAEVAVLLADGDRRIRDGEAGEDRGPPGRIAPRRFGLLDRSADREGAPPGRIFA